MNILKKSLSLILIFSLIFSINIPFSFADEEPKGKLIIDLSEYDGRIKTKNGNGKYTENWIDFYENADSASSKKIIKSKEKIEMIIQKEEEYIGTIELLDFDYIQSEGNCAFEIDGLDKSEYLKEGKNSEGKITGYSLLKKKNKTQSALRFYKNVQNNSMCIKVALYELDWRDKTVTIKPKLSKFNVEAEAAEGAQGTAKSNIEANGDCTFTAKGNDGYAFDYWVKKGEENIENNRIYQNPYTTSVNENTTYTAYFRERYKTDFVSDDEDMGKVEAEYINSSEGKDKYSLTAKPNTLYKFLKWQIGEGEDVTYNTENPTKIEVGEGDKPKKYTAFFEKANVFLLEQMADYDGNGEKNYIGIRYFDNEAIKQPEIQTLGSMTKKELLSGRRCQVSIPFAVDGDISGDYYFTLSLSSADGNVKICDNQIVGKFGDNVLLEREKYSICIVVDPMPKIEGLKAQLILRTSSDRLETVEKIYEDVRTLDSNSEDNDKYKYLKSTDMGHKSEAGNPADSGLSAIGVYGRVNPVTKDAEVYLHGKDGVAMIKAQPGKDLTFLGKFPDDIGIKWGDQGIFALGSASDGGLIALAEVDEKHIENITTPGYENVPSNGGDKKGKHFIYKWNGTQWSRIENSCFSRYQINNKGKANYFQPMAHLGGVQAQPNEFSGVIMSENDIWTNYYHWDGTKWEMNPGNLVFFTMFKKNESVAYGSTLDGVYRYQDGTWNKMFEAAGGKEYHIAGINTKGHLLLRDSRNTHGRNIQYYDADVDKKTVTEITKFPNDLIFDSHVQRTAGIDDENQIYTFQSTRVHSASGGPYASGDLFRYDNGNWKMQNIKEFDDPADKKDESRPRIRPDGVTHISNPLPGISILHGPESLGANYMYAKDVTVTFDAQGGTFRDESKKSITAPILSSITTDKVPSVSKADKYFAGWYYDAACSTGKEWDLDTARMPAENITIYAKWIDKGSNQGGTEDNPELKFHRKKALTTLQQAFEKCEQGDYKPNKWKLVVKAYEDGKNAINAAAPSDGPYIENNIIKELNKAIAAIQAIPAEKAGKIDVVVSMDANTLGLGYLIKPTLVTVKKGTVASEVTDDLIRDMTREKFGVSGKTLSSKGNSEPKNKYPSIITGSLTDSYYLAQVYYPAQKDVKIADFILNRTGEAAINEDDKNGNYLGEFDYYNMSGWMYSVSDGSKYPAFPGMGAASWKLSDGEVVRWQFTVYGYGADLNADNSAWGTSSVVPNLADKTSLTKFVAELRRDYKDSVLEQEEAYNDAIKALTNPSINQADINAAEKKLEAVKFPEPANEVPNIKPKTTVTGDTATAEVKSEELKKAIDQAEKDKKDNIVINVETNANIKEANLHIAKSDVEVLAKKEKIRLDVKTPNGNVEIPSAVLKSISNQAKGKDISISVGDVKAFEAIDVKVEKGKVLSKEKLAVKEAVEKIYKSLPIFKVQPDMAEGLKTADIAVLEVNIKSANKYISRLGGKIGISIPTSNKYEKDKEYEVTQISEDGTAEKLKGKCDQESGKRYVKIEVSHLSTFVVNPEPVSNLTFTDIAGHWAYEAIKYAVESKLMAGISTDKFNPDGTLSRAMLATILYRVEKEPTVSQAPKYTDVEKGKWYTDAVAWASKEGIVAGYSDSVFAPNDNITREQMAAMLRRYSEYKKLDATKSKELSGFADANTVSSWAADPIKWAVAENLIHGRTKDTIVPKGTATRAEAATILKSYMENIVKSKKTETKTGAEKTDDKKSDAKKAG